MADNVQWRAPAVDVYESDASWQLVADLPHVDRDDLELTVHEGVLKLRAARGDVGYERSFRLPTGMRGDQVAASLADGVLTLTLTKPDEARPQRIAIA